MLRTRLVVEAPECFGAFGNLQRAELWHVEVRQVPLAVGASFTVQASLVHEVGPEGPRTIPGVQVPSRKPRAFSSLAAARKDARRLAAVLSRSLHPAWTEQHWPPKRP